MNSFEIILGVYHKKLKFIYSNINIPSNAIIKDIKTNSNILSFKLGVHGTQAINYNYNDEIKSGEYDIVLEVEEPDKCDNIIVNIELNFNILMLYQTLSNFSKTFGVETSKYMCQTNKCSEPITNIKSLIDKSNKYIDKNTIDIENFTNILSDIKNKVNSLHNEIENMKQEISNVDSSTNANIESSTKNIMNVISKNNSSLLFNEINNKLIELSGLTRQGNKSDNQIDEQFIAKLKKENQAIKESFNIYKNKLIEAENYIDELEKMCRVNVQ